jgi:hypothetical protein
MKRFLIGAVVFGCCLCGAALAADSPQVDPGTVPGGALVFRNQVQTPLEIKVGSDPTRPLPDGARVYINHAQLKAGQSSGWHTHPGPAFVTIVKGSLTLYDAPAAGDEKGPGDGDHGAESNNGRGACPGVTYTAGQGFVDMGFGHVHLAIAGKEGADFYATFIVPPDSPGDAVTIPAAAPSNAACPRG